MLLKAAIVTGAGSGIGKAIAKVLAEDQYGVCVADINVHNAEFVAEEINQQGGKAIALHVDIREENSIEVMMKKTVEYFGNLFLLVNNAGVNFTESVETCSIDDFDACIAINLRGHYLVSKHAIAHLRKYSGSNIVNIASTHGIRTQPKYFPYSVAKAGMLAMTRSMAIDFSNDHIRVNAICPGLIQTPIMDSGLFDKDSTYYQKVIKYHPVGRIGKPEDIAYTVSFLASERASFINGETIVIDGGRSALTYSLE
jgi:NAD(P)-dependent dehydrogenase (short-subunit alcohol dehydrogenase family)